MILIWYSNLNLNLSLIHSNGDEDYCDDLVGFSDEDDVSFEKDSSDSGGVTGVGDVQQLIDDLFAYN